MPTGTVEEESVTREPSNSDSTVDKYLTPEEVVTRYRGEISAGTLRNWRAMRIGPTFVKIGKAFFTRSRDWTRGIRRTW